MSATGLLSCIFLLLSLGSPAQQPRLVLPIGHTSDVRAITFSPDGKKILSASDDKTAKIWDRSSGNLLANLALHNGIILSAFYSRDNKFIITASFDSTAIIWDATTGEFIRKLKFSTGRMSFANFSPDGKYVAAIGEDFTRETKEGRSMVYGNEAIEIWETSTGKLLHRLDSVWGHIESLVFSPDSKYILTVISIREDFGKVQYNRILVWDAGAGKIVQELKGDLADLSPDGGQIITATKNGTLQLQEFLTGKIIYDLADTTVKISQLGFSPGGKYIYSYSDSSLCIRDARSGQITVKQDHDESEIKNISFSPDGNSFATMFYSVVLITDAASGKITDTLENRGFFNKNFVFSPDSKYLVFSTFENDLLVWDLKARAVVTALKGHTAEPRQAVFSPDGKYFLTVVQEPALTDYSVIVWDLDKGKQLYRLRSPWNEIVFARFTPDSKQIILADKNDIISFRNAASGKLNREFEVRIGYSYSFDISPDSRQFLLTDYHGNVITGSIGNKANIYPLIKSTSRSRIHSAFFSPDGKKIVTATGDDQIIVWDAVSRKQLYRVFGHTIPRKDIEAGTVSSIFSSLTVAVSFSKDGKYMITVSPFGPVKKWETATGRFITELKKESWAYYTAQLSPGNKWLATTSYSSEIKLWDAATFGIRNTLQGHAARVTDAVFDPPGKNLLTTSTDNTTMAWDPEAGKLKYTFLTIDSSGYFFYLPSQYYSGSTDAARLLHYVTKDLKVISFEQLDVKYNRPDKVLEAVGSSDTALIRSYRKAWEKRIKKLGIDTTAFKEGYSVPECDFADRDAIPYEQKNGTISLRIRGADSSYTLDRFNIWVNETPLFGQRGISIRKMNSNKLDTVLLIELSQGVNRIETSVINVNGTESYRMPLYVNYTPAVRQKESLRFIGIGIDQFANKDYNLQYSSKDIRDLAIKLKEKYKDDIIIDTLFNQDVTTEKVKALKQGLKQTTVNDKVIVSYSGHGLLSREFDYYLSTWSINFNKPEETGLPYDALEDLLDSIPARRKLMLIDACHSGEVDKEEMTRITLAADSLKKQGTKGGVPTYTGKTSLGMKNSFELMQNLFVNVGKSTGATIISAAAGTQFALERGDLENGVFTYSILEAMNIYPAIRISELKKIVGERVEQLTNGLQKPTSRNETIASDWSLW